MLASSARAQPTTKAADDAFEKGRSLMAAGDHARACPAFELSQRLDPQFGTQYNLANCYVALGKLASAWNLFRELARGDPNRQRRERSVQLEKQLARRVPKLQINVRSTAADEPLAGLQVFIDKTDVTQLAGVELPFDLGTYTIRATASGHKAVQKVVSVEVEGRVLTVDLAFEREVSVTKVPPAGAGAGVGAGRQHARRVRYGKVMAGAGVGLVGIGLGAGWRAIVHRGAAEDRCSASGCPDRPGAEAAIDRARLWANLSTVTVVIGVAAAATGVYVWRSSRAKIGASVAPTTASVIVSGTF